MDEFLSKFPTADQQRLRPGEAISLGGLHLHHLHEIGITQHLVALAGVDQVREELEVGIQAKRTLVLSVAALATKVEV